MCIVLPSYYSSDNTINLITCSWKKHSITLRLCKSLDYMQAHIRTHVGVSHEANVFILNQMRTHNTSLLIKGHCICRHPFKTYLPPIKAAIFVQSCVHYYDF